jgi:hypothetical protein
MLRAIGSEPKILREKQMLDDQVHEVLFSDATLKLGEIHGALLKSAHIMDKERWVPAKTESGFTIERVDERHDDSSGFLDRARKRSVSANEIFRNFGSMTAVPVFATALALPSLRRRFTHITNPVSS